MANINTLRGVVSKITEVSTRSGLRKVIGRIVVDADTSTTIKAFGVEARALKAVEYQKCTLYGRAEACIKIPGTYEFIVRCV